MFRIILYFRLTVTSNYDYMFTKGILFVIRGLSAYIASFNLKKVCV